MKRAGQVILFRFPQADLKEGKLRPALLLGRLPGEYEDWICMISSQLHHYVADFDELVQASDADFAESGLKVPRVITGRTFSSGGRRDSLGCHWSNFERQVGTDQEAASRVVGKRLDGG